MIYGTTADSLNDDQLINACTYDNEEGLIFGLAATDRHGGVLHQKFVIMVRARNKLSKYVLKYG